jgi:hypothetical protein
MMASLGFIHHEAKTVLKEAELIREERQGRHTIYHLQQ